MVKTERKVNVIGVIHARGGSKRIPLKNIALLAGRPLVSYMIAAALSSKYLRRVIVSTDHMRIKEISLSCGAEVPFMRPVHLAEDCPSEWVTRHAVEFVEQEESSKVDIAVTMQPTTPFCRRGDIDACVELLLKNKTMGSAFTAKQARERPEWMFSLKDTGFAELFMGGKLEGERGIFQSLPKLVMPNGATYATTRKTLFEEGVLISKNTGAHVMSDLLSVDIDEQVDLLFAEFLLNKKEVVANGQ